MDRLNNHTNSIMHANIYNLADINASNYMSGLKQMYEKMRTNQKLQIIGILSWMIVAVLVIACIVMEAYENEIYTYKIAIRKEDGRIWVVNISEDLYFKTLKHDDFVFELAMVFENDDMNGMVNTELSKVEAVYARGKDISDEDFVAQQELDKSWPMVTYFSL